MEDHRDRNKRIVESWPKWKREFAITRYSLRDNSYCIDYPEGEAPPNEEPDQWEEDDDAV